MIENKDVIEAIDRIARTPDGQMLFRHLQKICLAVATPESSHGALRQHEGRRMFASELMGMMSKGIADSDRYAITFVRTAAEPATRSRGAGRRITAATPVAGWDTEPTAAAGNTSPANTPGGGSSGPNAT
jgi:hypothetical protein